MILVLILQLVQAAKQDIKRIVKIPAQFVLSIPTPLLELLPALIALSPSILPLVLLPAQVVSLGVKHVMMEVLVTVVLQVIIEIQAISVPLALPIPTLLMPALLLVRAAVQANTLSQDPLLAQIA